MKTCFCILWMPTITHHSFQTPKCEASKIFEISDDLSSRTLKTQKDGKVYAKVELNVNKNISIYFYRDKKGNSEIENSTIQLIYEDHSHNGLFKYKITIPEEGHFAIWNNESECFQFPCDIYHKIKEFYHQHEHHYADDGDSMIKPYISTDDVNLNSCDNNALVHYLKEYETKFQTSHEYILPIYNKLANNKFEKWKMFFSPRSNHHSFHRLISRLKGDKAYYNSLYFSCYNKNIKVQEVDYTDEEAKEKRRRAFNVENIISNIRTMEERINNKFNLSNSKISFWIALFAILISITTYYASKDSSTTSNTEYKEEQCEILKNLENIESLIKDSQQTSDTINGGNLEYL